MDSFWDLGPESKAPDANAVQQARLADAQAKLAQYGAKIQPMFSNVYTANKKTCIHMCSRIAFFASQLAQDSWKEGFVAAVPWETQIRNGGR